MVVKGAGAKAFCAGGDVAALADDAASGPAGQARSAAFFAREYRLNHLIATYAKPYVALLDGITMGGGVGLALHAPFRVATERTLLAMPEAAIGFFPDVGASFFLPRLDGELGAYLALTGARVAGAHALLAGLATHYLHSSALADAEARLAELRFADGASLAARCAVVDATLEEFVSGLPAGAAAANPLAGATRAAIDRCFAHDTVEPILAALLREDTEWAASTKAAIEARSPTSVRVALRQVRLGRGWDIATAFQREHLLALKFMAHPDFVAGVRATLTKGAPPAQWAPATLADTPESVVDEFFAIEEGGWRLPLLRQGAEPYMQYPHAHFGLPAEQRIKEAVQSQLLTERDVVELFVDRAHGKMGVREKV